jgi:D-lactate dehydrogenase
MAEPAADRVPDALAGGTPEPLRSQLQALVGAEQVRHRVSDLVRYAADASPYRLLPQAVVTARDADDVRRVIAFARSAGIPVTLRSGGTSLCGQAQSDGILIDVRHHWRGVEIEDDGARVRVKPGTVLAHVNRRLARHGRRLGPDPASVEACTVGGVIANNSGGMRCGTTADAYSTVRSMTLLLASGTLIDTAAPDAEARFAADEPRLAAGLLALRDELLADADLAQRVRRKFEIKNTTGYRLCALLDADTPLEIFRRLVVGSEGTLALIAEAVFETVAVPKRSAIAWLHFADIDAAVAPVSDLVALGASAVELVGAELLHVAADTVPGSPGDWRDLPPESAALLVELSADDDAALDEMEAKAAAVAESNPLLAPLEPFARDPRAVANAWRVRNGKFGLFGRVRPPGSSMILEDLVVRPERFAACVTTIQELMARHGFPPNVSGHVSAGNVHFYLTPMFGDPAEVARFEALVDDLVALVVDEHDGSLKGEHGTGRMMAPFVEREWGAKATEMMWRIKELADPDAVLSPGIVLNRDPRIHVANLKSTPAVEDEVTMCVECGLCEPVCPSRTLTVTPRQRIVLRRELARQAPGSPVARALAAEYRYDGIDTCAADGSCAIVCPLGIDTGAMVKGLRAEHHGPLARRAAGIAADHWAGVERAARGGLRAGHALGDRTTSALTGAARRVAGDDRVPAWVAPMPAPAGALRGEPAPTAAARYLPSCTNRMFDDGGLIQALLDVSQRAGSPLALIDEPGLCCGQPFDSKGFAEAGRRIAGRAVAAGVRPVVVDANSCAMSLGDHNPDLQVLDAIHWACGLLPRLTIKRRVARVALHPTCSLRHLGLEDDLRELAEAMADEVVLPAAASCCGMAGDRGLLHPELTAAALADEAAELRSAGPFDAHLCGNRTCEIALQRATGADYVSPIVLLDELTR